MSSQQPNLPNAGSESLNSNLESAPPATATSAAPPAAAAATDGFNPGLINLSAGFAFGNGATASNPSGLFPTTGLPSGSPFQIPPIFGVPGAGPSHTPSGIPIVDFSQIAFSFPPPGAMGSGMSFGGAGEGGGGGGAFGAGGTFGGFGNFGMPARSFPSRRKEEPVGEPFDDLHVLATTLHADASLSLDERRRTFTDAFVKLWNEAQEQPLRYNTKLQMLKNSIDVTQLIIGDHITSSFAEKTIPLLIFDTPLNHKWSEIPKSYKPNELADTVLAATIHTLWLSHECPLVLSHEVLPFILDNLSLHGYNCSLNTAAESRNRNETDYESIIDLIVSYGTTWYTGKADNEDARFPVDFFWRILEILVQQPSCTADVINAPQQQSFEQFGPALASWIDSYSHMPDVCLPMIKLLRKDLSKIADPNIPLFEWTSLHFFVRAKHPYPFLLWMQWELQQDNPRQRLLQFCTQSKSCKTIHAPATTETADASSSAAADAAASSFSPFVAVKKTLTEITLLSSLVEEMQSVKLEHPENEATARNSALVEKLVAFQNAQADLNADSAESQASIKEFQTWIQQQIDSLPPALKEVQKSRDEQMMEDFMNKQKK